MDKASYELYKYINGPMHQPLRHDSAHKHVSGSAEYIDDRRRMMQWYSNQIAKWSRQAVKQAAAERKKLEAALAL